MFKSHPEVFSSWQLIRTPHPPGFRPPPSDQMDNPPPRHEPAAVVPSGAIFNERAIQKMLDDMKQRNVSSEKKLRKWLANRMDRFEEVLRAELARIDQATDSLRRPVPEAIVQPIQNIETIEPRQRRKPPAAQSFPSEESSSLNRVATPSSGFQAPSSGFHAPSSGFQAPSSGFQAPTIIPEVPTDTTTSDLGSLPHTASQPQPVPVRVEEEEEEEEEAPPGLFESVEGAPSQPQDLADGLDATMPPPPEVISDGDVPDLSSPAPDERSLSPVEQNSEDAGDFAFTDDPPEFGGTANSAFDAVGNGEEEITSVQVSTYRPVVNLDELDLDMES
jgi:hypothetical protein